MKNVGAIVAVVALVACGSPEKRIETIEELRVAVEALPALRGAVTLDAYTEADDSRFGRRGRLDWASGGNFTLTVLEDSTDAISALYHLHGTSLTRVGADSVRTVSEVDPFDEPIPNYYTGLLVPAMLLDTAWFADWAADSTVSFTLDADQIRLQKTAHYDPSEEDYHPDSRWTDLWIFDAQTGRPLRFEDNWYRGDMAYGREMTVTFDWTESSDAVALAVADWVAPSWSREPAPAVAGPDPSADEDWYEATMAALPAVDAPAPVLSGQLLAGSSASLADFSGQLLYLDFWYIGCGPCMQALPHLAELQATYGEQGLSILGANSHQNASTISRYLNRRGLEVPQLVLDSLPAQDWPIRAYPTWFLIGRDGRVIERGMGFGGEESVAALDSMIQVHL